MSLIDTTYFTQGELKLPIDNIDIKFFIDEHEPKILKDILGYNLYKDFIAGLAVLPTPNQKWLELRDGKEYTDTSDELQKYEGVFWIIADYVYFKIIADIQSYATDSGVTIGETDNARKTHSRYKQTFAYNDMVDRIKFMNDFIIATNDASADTYENYVKNTGLDIKVNVLNI